MVSLSQNIPQMVIQAIYVILYPMDIVVLTAAALSFISMLMMGTSALTLKSDAEEQLKQIIELSELQSDSKGPEAGHQSGVGSASVSYYFMESLKKTFSRYQSCFQFYI